MPTRSASWCARSIAAIAGYVRGQALVCIALGSIYAIGLSLVGLEFGLIIGLIAGPISFIPFVGTFVGGVMALGMALAQFPPDWSASPRWRRVLVGQSMEGNVPSPKLVGDRVGLHPVWIMFALLAEVAVRLRRRPDRRADGGGDRCDRAPSAGRYRERHLSWRRSGLRRAMANQLTFDLGAAAANLCARGFRRRPPAIGEALAWIDRWPDWPAPALALSGPAGCGKTHLGRIWAARAGATLIDGTALEGKSVADLSDLAATSPRS